MFGSQHRTIASGLLGRRGRSGTVRLRSGGEAQGFGGIGAIAEFGSLQFRPLERLRHRVCCSSVTCRPGRGGRD